ncbi:probable glucan endo-1,3-beta-glucosidase BG4 [Corylus avellana]|uniref:probable glucan endo-1,3-beta-glucosidase BG4 n=1 Tax=Corylus avellana TaxID=13451 RepID=UPI00286BADDA|nr:probable glucan endo-1,3-beta-glucosidase BG4 [Corylus avellana]
MAMNVFWKVMMIVCGIVAIHEHIIGTRTAVADFYSVGVVYGRTGNDIPDENSVVELCHKYCLKKVRILEGNPRLMNALIDQNIAVTIDIKNFRLPYMANNNGRDAYDWIQNNVMPFIGKVQIEQIVVGNEAIPGIFSRHVAPAIENIKNELLQQDLNILLTTAVSTSVLSATFPPSNAAFKDDTRQHMIDVIKAMEALYHKPVLMVNVFPYDYYAAGLIRQDFATFTADETIYRDGSNGYWNMLDALLDAFNHAVSKEGLGRLSLVVGGSGWPSDGNGNFTTPALAATYNQNFMKRLARVQGTPARLGYPVKGFVYALFNENMRLPGPPRHFGLFNTNKTPAYLFHAPGCKV